MNVSPLFRAVIRVQWSIRCWSSGTPVDVALVSANVSATSAHQDLCDMCEIRLVWTLRVIVAARYSPEWIIGSCFLLLIALQSKSNEGGPVTNKVKMAISASTDKDILCGRWY